MSARRTTVAAAANARAECYLPVNTLRHPTTLGPHIRRRQRLPWKSTHASSLEGTEDSEQSCHAQASLLAAVALKGHNLPREHVTSPRQGTTARESDAAHGACPAAERGGRCTRAAVRRRRPSRCTRARAAPRRPSSGGLWGRGLHSSTSQLNLSALSGIGGAHRGWVARVKGVLAGV